MASILLWGNVSCIGIFAGAFAVYAITFASHDLSLASSLFSALCIGAGNTLESFIGAYLVRKYCGTNNLFLKTRFIIRFIIFGAINSTTISATIGVTSICTWSIVEWNKFFCLWWTWWTGNMAGALVLAPFMLVWLQKKSGSGKHISLLKITIIYTSLLLVLLLTFTFRDNLKPIQFHRIEYLTIPIILWSIFQYGKRGSTSSIMLTCIIASYFTTRGYGPFIIAPHNDPLLLLPLYLSVIAVTALILTASLEERETISNKLKLSESILSDLYENAPDMYATVDANTTEILQCNKTVVDKLGYGKEELIGKSVFSVYHLESVEDAKKIFSSVRDKGAVHDAELQLQCKNGKTIDVSLNATSIRNEKGNIIRNRYVWRDITDHKRAERQIYLAQRMETIGRLIGNVAHDFNNILMAIIRYSKLTQMKLNDTSPLKEYLDNNVLCSQRASTLIKDLHSLGKNQPSEQKPLSIVYGIVKQHNAHINVFSEHGKGARFEIYFPYIDIPKNEKEITPQQLSVALEGTETLLIAEDQDDVRNILQKLLEEKGYTIITAKDGADAIAKFEKHKDTIEMLLFDVMMPNKSETSWILNPLKHAHHTNRLYRIRGFITINITYVLQNL